MFTRRLGKTGWTVSAIGFGAWQLGGDWGPVDDRTAMAALHTAADAGVTFLDTADVYGDGRSEQLIGRFLRERDGDLRVATKMGRRAPLDPDHYTLDSFHRWTDRSRENLGVETLDLVQLHCPPTAVYDSEAVFDALDALVAEGATHHYGVSVETVDEGLRALRWPNLATIQVIFNCFRQKPAEQLLGAAASAHVGVIARVPLASGLLTGKLTRDTEFRPDDHRHFNRDGAAFDVGETFAGVDYERGLAAVDRLRPLVPGEATLAQLALRWILMHEPVSTTIPGARNPDQARANAAAADLPPLDDETMRAIARVYAEDVALLVHDRW